jgi:hypothetical protein
VNNISIDYILDHKDLEEEYYKFLQNENNENLLDFLREIKYLHNCEDKEIDKKIFFIITEYMNIDKKKYIPFPMTMAKEFADKFKLGVKLKKDLNLELLFKNVKEYIYDELVKNSFNRFIEFKMDDERIIEENNKDCLDKHKLIFIIKKYITMSSIKVNLRKEKRCFTGILSCLKLGKMFIDTIYKHSNNLLTRHDSVVLAQEYLSNFVIKCITITITKLFDNDFVYYRFTEHFNCKKNLNLNIEYHDTEYLERPFSAKKEPSQVVKILYWLLKQIVDEFVQKTKKNVVLKNLNYKKLINSSLIREIQKEVYHLQKFNILSISGIYYFNERG